MSKRTHGLSSTRVAKIWYGMRQRCSNPNAERYECYGGRGISVCARWMRLENFVADMGLPLPTQMIDRINNDGNYEPSNCRWASAKVNCRNRRSCKYITYQGRTRCVKEWAEVTKIPYTTLNSRRIAGWSIERMFTGVDK